MQTNEALKLQVAKDFSVPAERLYRAWITPENLKHWWHPMGAQLVEVTNEVREGGQIRYVFGNSHHNTTFQITGQYQQVQEAKLLVYTWNWEIPEQTVENSQFILHIAFSSHGTGSRLEVTQENFENEEAVHPHREGWEKALNDLEIYLNKSR